VAGGFRHPVQDGTIAARSPIIAPMSTPGPDRPYRSWMCVVCGHVYDEAQGAPEDGIPPGTRWEDVPDTWTCPDCGVTKDDFELYEG
jgi:rubredoxin